MVTRKDMWRGGSGTHASGTTSNVGGVGSGAAYFCSNADAGADKETEDASTGAAAANDGLVPPMTKLLAALVNPD